MATMPSSARLNLKQPHTFIGPKDEQGHLWALQNGIIYAWSDSNYGYEVAWWLDSEGKPTPGRTMNHQRLIDNIVRDRPFNPEWLNA